MEPVNYFQKVGRILRLLQKNFIFSLIKLIGDLIKLVKQDMRSQNNYFTFYDKNNFSGMATKVLKTFFDKIFLSKKGLCSLERAQIYKQSIRASE